MISLYFKTSVLCYCLFFVSFLIQSQSQDNYSLLWKIEGQKSAKPSYLFGTMHVDDVRAFQFSDAVMPAIESCDIFALEINPDSLMVAMNNKVVTEDPKSIFKSLLDEQEYKKLVKRFEEINSYSFEDSELKDPNIILSLMYPREERHDDMSTFVDMYLCGQAKTMRKQIVGLETVESQLNYFENLNEDAQRNYILDHIEGTKKEIDSTLNKLTEIYYTGDLNAINRVLIEDYGGNDEEMIARNKVMCRSIDSIVKTNHSLFSAVGTAHLPGQDGVIQLLKDKGYKVTPVEAVFTGVAKTYKIDQSKMDWHTFHDKDTGYSVEVPGAPNFTEDFKTFQIHSYSSMLDPTVYLMLGLDLRQAPTELTFDDLSERYLTNILKANDGEVISEDKGKNRDGQYMLNDIIAGDGQHIKSKMVYKDQLFYYVSVQYDKDNVNLNSVNRFLNSLAFSEPKPIERKNTDWQVRIYEDAAFSVHVPGEIKDLSREVINPLDPDGEPYKLKIYNAMDLDNKNNYLFRYNDLPTGYYLQNPEDGFSSMAENFTSKGTLVSEPKTISLNGYEGREYEILLQDKYHTFVRIYFRGNRSYLLLQQKLNDKDKVNVDNPFFNDFKFLDYKPAPFQVKKIDNTQMEIMQFDNYRKEIDTVDYDTSYLKNSVEYYTTNPNSGDVYHFSYGDFQDYFKTTDLSEFYDLNLEMLRDWNDSIVDKNPVKIGHKEGVEAYIKNKANSITTYHKIWIQGKRMIMMTAYTANEVYNKKMTDSILGYFKDTSPEENFDIYASKTSQIIRDLKSNDTIIRKSAIGAFDYYEFEDEDLGQLHDAIRSDFGKTDFDTKVKHKILDEFVQLQNDKTLKVLTEVYDDPKTNDDLKSKIISIVPQLKDDSALSTYKTLLFNKTPEHVENYQWQMFNTFRDSVPMTLAHFDDLVKLIDNDGLRASVLGLATDILEYNPDSTGIVKNRINTLLKHANDDLKLYITDVEDTTNYSYTYNSRIYRYLKLMQDTAAKPENIDTFTKTLIHRKDNDWFKRHAAIARVNHDLPTESKILKALIDSTTSRFAMIKAYHKVGKLDAIPKEYINPEALAKLSLANYLEDSDDYGFEIATLGTYKKEDNDYYAMSINYESDDNNNESYFALVGPTYNLAEKDRCEPYGILLDWSKLSEDWKAQAASILNQEKED